MCTYVVWTWRLLPVGHTASVHINIPPPSNYLHREVAVCLRSYICTYTYLQSSENSHTSHTWLDWTYLRASTHPSMCVRTYICMYCICKATAAAHMYSANIKCAWCTCCPVALLHMSSWTGLQTDSVREADKQVPHDVWRGTEHENVPWCRRASGCGIPT